MRDAVGTVSGVITDTNGNLLAGARVTAVVAGKAAGTLTVTTVANGHFVIPNVPVVNVINNNGPLGSGSGPAGTAVTLAIEAPTGYLSATAQVRPQAQVTSSENGGIIQGGDTNPQVIWFDHFNADAGTIRLPATIATITGTLRNATTGAAIGGFPMRATFEQVQPDQFGTPPGTNNAVVVSYGSIGTQTTTTQANGVFFFNNLPDNSCMRIYAPGLNFLALGGGGFTSEDYGDALCTAPGDSINSLSFIAISTQDDFVQLNRVFVDNSETRDEIRPFVISVGNASYVDGPCGTFDSTVTDTITITFSEPVTVSGLVDGDNPVTVLVGAFPNFTFIDVTAATLSADGRTITLTLAEDVPLAGEVTINIPVEDVRDLAGNPLNAGPGVQFDSIITTVNGNSVENVVDSLCFNTFAPGEQPTDDFLVDQVSPPLNDGDPLEGLFATTTALIDTVADGEPSSAIDATGAEICFEGVTGTCDDALGFGDGDIEQFNAFQLPRVGLKLDALASTLAATPIDTHTHIARIRINEVPPGTTNFAVALINQGTGLPKQALFFPVRTTEGGGNPTALGEVSDGNADACGDNCIDSINAGGTNWFSISPGGATEFDIIVAADTTAPANVGNPGKPNPGDIFVAIARGTSGGNFIIGPSSQVTLTDQVGPTVGLQFLCATATVCADPITAASVFGQGGVVLNQGDQDTGTVLLSITPQTGDTSEATTGGSNGTANGYYDDDYDDEMFAPSALADTTFVEAVRTDSAGQFRSITDATGMNTYLTTNASAGGALNARIAIDMVEAVNLLPAGLPAAPSTGNSALSAYVAIPNVAAENGAINNDEVTFVVDDIFAIEEDAIESGVIDLTAGIEDLEGNSAGGLSGDVGPDSAANSDLNASVRLIDRKPPLMVAAIFDGENTYLQFTEPVLLQGSVTFLGCTTIALDGNPDIVLSADGTVIQIPVTVDNTATCFSATSDPETYPEPLITLAFADAIADEVGGTLAVSDVPTDLRHAEVGYRDVPDAQGNIWDCGFGGGGGAHTSPGGTEATISGDPATYCAGVGTFPADATFVWAGAQVGIGGPTFMAASLVPPFAPIAVSRGTTYSSVVGGIAGDTFNIDITFSQPFFVTDAVAGADPRDDFDGTDADEDCGVGLGIDDGDVTQAELLCWVALKFEYFEDNTDTVNAPTDVQILDTNDQDITTVTGDALFATRIILTFTQVGPIVGGDQVRMIAGTTLTAVFDETNFTNIFPFDEGTGQPNGTNPLNAGDGHNQLEELQFIPPIPAGYSCPQTTFVPSPTPNADPGADPSDGEC